MPSIVKGGNFETALAHAAGTYGLTDGSQIAVQGTFAFGKESTLPIVGGTGHVRGRKRPPRHDGRRQLLDGHPDDPSVARSLARFGGRGRLRPRPGDAVRVAP